MGVFTDSMDSEVRLEFMRPAEVNAARKSLPAIFVPFGAIEWHGHHNPLGLDGLKAHEQLVGLAQKVGGVVYPPVYFGSGGGHTEWPSTYMVSARAMITIVTELLAGFERNGYEKAILLSGHYPNRWEFIDPAVTDYLVRGGRMQVLALIENQAPGVGGDHAAYYETSAMLYLHPDTVAFDELLAHEEPISPAGKTVNWMEDEYVDHPLYGLLGIDARHASVEVGRVSTERLHEFLIKWLQMG
ncbi:MAG: creatininase family protein [Caldilineales bacterium]|nr:creatininase family protein [Caldilineales bacterium]